MRLFLNNPDAFPAGDGPSGSRVVLPGVGDRTDMRKRQGDVEVIIREEPHGHLTRSGVKDLIAATATSTTDDDDGAPSAVVSCDADQDAFLAVLL